MTEPSVSSLEVSPVHGFDPLSTEVRRCPHSHYPAINAQPVFPLSGYPNFYLVSGYDTVSEVLMDPDTYDGQPFPGQDVPVMSAMRPEPHGRLRGAIQSLFTNRSLEKLTPFIIEVIRKRTERLLEEDGDLMQIWANPIPLSVIARMFGFPQSEKDLARLHRYGDAVIRLIIPVGGPGLPLPRGLRARIRQVLGFARAIPSVLRLLMQMPAESRKALLNSPNPMADVPGYPRTGFPHRPELVHLLFDFNLEVLKIFKRHLANPGDDVVDALIPPYQRGELSLREMLASASQILVAGYETTASTLASAVFRLSQSPVLLQSLKDDNALIEPFVEELLRIDAPLQRTIRRTTRPVTLAGVALPENAQLIVMLGAANMDQGRFDDAGRFDLTRANSRRHLTFGRGIHMCIGAQLARLEARLAITELVNRVAEIHLDPARPPIRIVDKDVGMWGFSSLHVKLRRVDSV